MLTRVSKTWRVDFCVRTLNRLEFIASGRLWRALSAHRIQSAGIVRYAVVRPRDHRTDERYEH